MLSHMWSLWDVCTSRKDIQVADGFGQRTAVDTEAFRYMVDLT